MGNSPAISFECLPFYELTLDQLYELMALRQAIFVVEQDCPYLDADGKDQPAHHLLAYNQQREMVAYTRLLAPGISYDQYASIGRVITRASERRTGLGRRLMQESIAQCRKLYPDAGIKISAQCYLIEFYESFGFRSVGESYLEDGIPHISMILA
ncbi:GNAT family N-acetyltransferase [Flavilitoribacter nigricans]|uniref:GNAT family N-acetyltransferase n=1 Tax=Flavilitoribacter nigricans (strain ATCC 23147 / DSM 23189 / NBRC 102662 / NCIMB 1420 / SS-2) TaxID=1122177 RepID=A0A2D0NGF9_FLAN2|nr:GNAT family N-acetyltransferase [Flavilitoribacter nigricans]PHN07259.1 GNAT family N-acetyltransferase [Flavilitoribacter nigricans DSM 23189 = NBRC 102662]